MTILLPTSSSAKSAPHQALAGRPTQWEQVLCELRLPSKKPGNEYQFVRHSITATYFQPTSTPLTAFSGTTDVSGAKKNMLSGLRKQQQKPETARAAKARQGLPRKVFKADDDINKRDAGEGEVEKNDSDTRM